MFRKLWHALFPASSERQYQTVRYAFPLILVTAMFASFASIATDSSYITIRTDAETITRDQSFFIDVLVTAHVAVNAVDLTIAYPEDKIIIDSIDTGTSVITLWVNEPYAKDGTIYLSGGTYRKGFIGEHQIARIRAHATESGDARILLKDSQLLSGDGSGSDVQTVVSQDFNEVKIEISGDDEGVVTAKASISVVTDTDGDGDVDLGDVTLFMSAWFSKSSVFDFNGDGRMTFGDFSILLAESFIR